MDKINTIIVNDFLYTGVCYNMQPLCVCMSYQHIVELISQDHDVEVQVWQDDLVKQVKIPSQTVNLMIIILQLCMYAVLHTWFVLVSAIFFWFVYIRWRAYSHYFTVSIVIMVCFYTSALIQSLIQHMEEFSDQASAVPIHIRSRHSTEMLRW